MNLIARKPNPVPTASMPNHKFPIMDEVIAELAGRLKKIEADRTVLVREREALVKRSSDTFNLTKHAKALLAGDAYDPNADPLSTIAIINKKIAVMDQALHLGNLEMSRLLEDLSAAIWAEHFEEIREIERRRLMAAWALQDMNLQRERLREKLLKAKAGPHLPGDGQDLLGIGDRHDELHWVAERLLSASVITDSEFKARRI